MRILALAANYSPNNLQQRKGYNNSMPNRSSSDSISFGNTATAASELINKALDRSKLQALMDADVKSFKAKLSEIARGYEETFTQKLHRVIAKLRDDIKMPSEFAKTVEQGTFSESELATLAKEAEGLKAKAAKAQERLNKLLNLSPAEIEKRGQTVQELCLFKAAKKMMTDNNLPRYVYKKEVKTRTLAGTKINVKDTESIREDITRRPYGESASYTLYAGDKPFITFNATSSGDFTNQELIIDGLVGRPKCEVTSWHGERKTIPEMLTEKFAAIIGEE